MNINKAINSQFVDAMNCLTCQVECPRIQSIEEGIIDLYICNKCQDGFFYCIPCSNLFKHTQLLYKRHVRLVRHKKKCY